MLYCGLYIPDPSTVTTKIFQILVKVSEFPFVLGNFPVSHRLIGEPHEVSLSDSDRHGAHHRFLDLPKDVRNREYQLPVFHSRRTSFG